jgi:hypothetical protein
VRRRYLLASVLVILGATSVGCGQGESLLGRLTSQVASNRETEMKKLRSSPYYRPASRSSAGVQSDLAALARQ